jgi:peptidoglycan/LPS O-acetylase OafA/YrhL
LPQLRFLGRLSYAFYMSFGTIELFLAQLYRHEGWNPAHGKLAYTLAMTALTLLLALSLHSLIETPARRAVELRLAES